MSVAFDVNFVHIKVKANQEDSMEEKTDLLEECSMRIPFIVVELLNRL